MKCNRLLHREKASLIIPTSLFMLILLLSSPKAEAINFNATASCEQCISGTETEWNVTITNMGQTEIEIQSIEIMSARNQELITRYNTTAITIRANKKPASITFPGLLPNYKGKTSLDYNVCFQTLVPAYLRKIEDTALSDTRYFCEPQNMTLELFQCLNSSNCAWNEQCGNNECQKLQCKECGYASNHRCFSYECCSDENCTSSQSCKSNKCTTLNCSQAEQIINHSCSGLECAQNETLSNQKCTPLICKGDEGYINHTCAKLRCSSDEFISISGHKCAKLQCKNDEYALNHTCAKLKCLANQTASNHACAAKECAPYQRLTQEGKCAFNTDMTYLSFEAVALIGISVLLALLTAKLINRKKGGIKK